VAKSPLAYTSLSQQVRSRQLQRRYLALAWGSPEQDSFSVEVPIGRHLKERKRMAAVVAPSPQRKVRLARTEVVVRERLGPISLVECSLPTGRTHQIRVHLAHVGHPVVGDPVYGARRGRAEAASLPAPLRQLVAALRGQALHAHFLSLFHPETGNQLEFTAPVPEDMGVLLAALRAGTRRRQACSAKPLLCKATPRRG